MTMSAAIYRAQEAIQLDLAKNDPLENRRKIAAGAAKVWAREAMVAEWRESGRKGVFTRLDAEITAEFAEEADDRKKQQAS